MDINTAMHEYEELEKKIIELSKALKILRIKSKQIKEVVISHMDKHNLSTFTIGKTQFKKKQVKEVKINKTTLENSNIPDKYKSAYIKNNSYLEDKVITKKLKK